MIRVFLVLVMVSLGMSLKAFAQETTAAESSQVDEAHEAEIAQKVKKRLYPGGRDEEDLKVQPQLTTPTRKLSPQAELKEEPVEE